MTPPPKPLALLASLTLALLASPARADAPAPAPRQLGLRLDADLDLGAPMGISESRLSVGVGGRLDVGPVWLQPEVGGSYTAFTTYTPRPPKNPLMPDPYTFCEVCLHLIDEHPARVVGGLRLGGAGLISGVIEPAIFGHAGYGWVTSGVHEYRPWSGGVSAAYILDRIVRHFRFGLHAAYNVVISLPTSEYGASPHDDVKWLSYGLHLGVAR